LTSFFFFGPISIGWLFQMMFLTRFGGELERNWFIGPHRTSDFAWCWILCGLALLVSGLLIPLKVYGPSLVFAMLYIWSRKSPHTPVNVWGFSFLSWHLPFVYMGLSVLMSGGLGAAIPDALGILAGHLYHFSADICPRVYNKQIIHTPSFLITLVEHTIPSVFGTPAATPARAADPDQTRAAWRRTPGHRLD
jgi:Derlin-2/3